MRVLVGLNPKQDAFYAKFSCIRRERDGDIEKERERGRREKGGEREIYIIERERRVICHTFGSIVLIFSCMRFLIPIEFENK